MHRHRYIRFFISSTFADMNIERNLLKGVFTKLNYYCESKGWQLETIDLRWGVSKEAGIDNKTMRICLSELKRCQELSPKPNFIILLGERYGWIPLPEIISIHDAEQILAIATYTEQALFNRWYMLDNNELPDGVFILRGREGQFSDPKMYAQLVELPLRDLFHRYAKTLQNEEHKIPFERSATEQEIQQGAMAVADASEHVLAYFRQIYDVPNDEQLIFHQSGTTNQENFKKEALSQLKQRIVSKLKPDNIYCENINYNYYRSPEYSVHFADEMEQRLRQIIDREIEENEVDCLQYEQAEHLEYAKRKAATFFGRETELQTIDAYLHDKKRNNTLWIQAQSGIGKSALLAKVVEKYCNSHDIICRFCGTTSQSCDGASLVCSIWEELKGLYELNWVTKELAESKKRKNDLSILGYMSSVEMFEIRLHQLQLRRPLLIVIDALNQLDVTSTPWLPRLDWLNGELASGVKIIISTINNYEYSFTPSRIEKLPLHGMGTEATPLVNNMLTLVGRRLQPAQWEKVREVIESSNKSPLYLTLLGKYLCRITSYQPIFELPADFEGLVKMILNILSANNNHGELIVSLSLSLLASDRLGLTNTEMTEVLALSDNFREQLKENSYYQWDNNGEEHSSIPPILWSRLYYDLSYFLQVRNTLAGEMIYIYHDELRHIINHLYLNSNIAQAYVYKLLYNYYAKKWQYGNKHALHELVHCCYSNVACLSNIPESKLIPSCKHSINFLQSLLHNITYLAQKSRYMSKNLADDFDKLITLMRYDGDVKDNGIQSILRLKNDVLELGGMAEDHFYSCAVNSPSDSPLHKLVNQLEGKEHYLNNVLRDVITNRHLLFKLNEVGMSPHINADGTRVVSLFSNQHEVRLKDLKDNRHSHIYTVQDKIIGFDTDASLNRHALLTAHYCLLYDVSTNEIVVRNSEIANACWVSLSADGSVFTYGGREGIYLHGYGIYNFDAPNGMLTPSGNYLWMINEGILRRLELKTGDLRNFPFELEDKNFLTAPNTHVDSCTDHLCYVIGDNLLVFIGTYETPEGKAQFSGQIRSISPGSTFTAIREDERQTLIVNDTGFYHLFHIANYKLDKEISGKIQALTCISHNFNTVLLKYERNISDFNKLINKFSPVNAPNAGINSLSSSTSGNLIGVSAGKNNLIDCLAEMLLIVFKKEHATKILWKLPEAKPYLYIAGSALAPDGSYIVASTFGEGLYSGKGEIVIAESDGTLISHTDIMNGSCTAIAISTDSRYVVAGTGHYIFDLESVFYLFTREGKLLEVIDRYKDLLLHGEFWLSTNNRYVLAGEFYYSVIDLITGELIGDKVEYDYVEWPSSSLLNTQGLVVMHPCGWLVLSTDKNNLNVLNLKSGIVDSTPYDKKLLGCSTSGRYLFVIDKENRLFHKNFITGEELYLMDGVSYVIPAFDEKHLFVVKSNAEICLINIFNATILQTTYFGYVYHFCITARGLCTVRPEGDVALFSPDVIFGVNQTAFATLVKPWNLETKQQEQKYVATCPLCGTNFQPSEDLINSINDLEQAVDNVNDKNSLWDDPRLINHHCPNCRGNLRFNPFFC